MNNIILTYETCTAEQTGQLKHAKDAFVYIKQHECKFNANPHNAMRVQPISEYNFVYIMLIIENAFIYKKINSL